MTHIIKEFHRVYPNWFPSIWYVPCKPCTYLASRLALSPNSRIELPLEPLHLGIQTGASKRFLRLWCIRHKLCTYLAPKLTLSPNRPKRDSIWHTLSRSSIGCVKIDFRTYCTFHAYRSINHASRLALSPNRASTWAPLPRSNITCVQNGFLAYGALGINRAHIFYQN